MPELDSVLQYVVTIRIAGAKSEVARVLAFSDMRASRKKCDAGFTAQMPVHGPACEACAGAPGLQVIQCGNASGHMERGHGWERVDVPGKAEGWRWMHACDMRDAHVRITAALVGGKLLCLVLYRDSGGRAAPVARSEQALPADEPGDVATALAQLHQFGQVSGLLPSATVVCMLNL